MESNDRCCSSEWQLVRFMVEGLAAAAFFVMDLITILNRCHRFRGFVYYQARFGPEPNSIEVALRPRQGSAAARLNNATGYITPKDMLAGRQQEIHAERDRKLEAARKQRQIRRQQAA